MPECLRTVRTTKNYSKSKWPQNLCVVLSAPHGLFRVFSSCCYTRVKRETEKADRELGGTGTTCPMGEHLCRCKCVAEASCCVGWCITGGLIFAKNKCFMRTQLSCFLFLLHRLTAAVEYA